MRRQPLYLHVFLVLTLVGTIAPGMARGQNPQFIPPHELYKFHMGSTNGYFYTPWYSQGAAYYSYHGPIGSGPSTGTTAAIYPNPQQGYTPDPAAGLLPLYQFTVIEGFRSYIHLSLYSYGQGSNYYFNGIAGYVYPPSTTVDSFGMPTVKVSAWYSQSRGYWYGINEPADGIYEHPPSGWGYQFHGVPFRLPAPPTTATGPGRCGSSFPYISCDGSRAVRFDPPQQCSDPAGEQNCGSSGGQWNPGNCTCSFMCDSWEEQNCYDSRGQWDPGTCTCSLCNPRSEDCFITN